MSDLNQVNLCHLVRIAYDAGQKILDVYQSDNFDIQIKQDNSPLTLADRQANDLIKEQLNKFYPDIPLLSEEERSIPFEERKNWDHFWLVDPLDGTKEFINRNGEFTVNIALIEHNIPVVGIICVPVENKIYFAKKGLGAYRCNETGNLSQVSNDEQLLEISAQLPDFKKDRIFTVVASRSHLSDDTKRFIDQLQEKHGDIDSISSGSSIKLCLVAEGRADVYPRFAPTMEWDTAAGQAIAETAGCSVVNAESHEQLRYNKEDLLNPWFIVQKDNAD